MPLLEIIRASAPLTLRLTLKYRTPSANSTKWAHWSRSRTQQLECFRALRSGFLAAGLSCSTKKTSGPERKIWSMVYDTLVCYQTTLRQKSAERSSRKKSNTIATRRPWLKSSTPSSPQTTNNTKNNQNYGKTKDSNGSTRRSRRDKQAADNREDPSEYQNPFD